VARGHTQKHHYESTQDRGAVRVTGQATRLDFPGVNQDQHQYSLFRLYMEVPNVPSRTSPGVCLNLVCAETSDKYVGVLDFRSYRRHFYKLPLMRPYAYAIRMAIQLSSGRSRILSSCQSENSGFCFIFAL